MSIFFPFEKFSQSTLKMIQSYKERNRLPFLLQTFELLSFLFPLFFPLLLSPYQMLGPENAEMNEVTSLPGSL